MAWSQIGTIWAQFGYWPVWLQHSLCPLMTHWSVDMFSNYRNLVSLFCVCLEKKSLMSWDLLSEHTEVIVQWAGHVNYKSERLTLFLVHVHRGWGIGCCNTRLTSAATTMRPKQLHNKCERCISVNSITFVAFSIQKYLMRTSELTKPDSLRN